MIILRGEYLEIWKFVVPYHFDLLLKSGLLNKMSSVFTFESFRFSELVPKSWSFVQEDESHSIDEHSSVGRDSNSFLILFGQFSVRGKDKLKSFVDVYGQSIILGCKYVLNHHQFTSKESKYWSMLKVLLNTSYTIRDYRIDSSQKPTH